MSGHSKWSTIKHKKAVQDAKRANVFTKLGNMISIAAREGGGDLEINFKLKMIVDKARSANMPKNNIERAIKRGVGELKDGSNIEEVIYEAYGCGQVAMLIKTATDNTNRTIGDVRHILTKAGGKMVPEGSVGFMFKKVGEIIIEANNDNIEEIEMQAIEAGAEDIKKEDNIIFVYTKPNEFQKIRETLKKNNLQITDAELIFIPTQKATLVSEEEKSKYDKLLENLDENDDVVEVYDNL